MDSRKSARKPLRQHVNLESPRIGPLVARSRDLSLGGMFVETGALVLPPNAAVAVSFSLENGGEHRAFNLLATVVRRAPEGAGLMFLQMGSDVIRSLSDVLSQYQHPSHEA